MRNIGVLVAKEIREALPATIFFLWLFHMIALTKAVSIGDYSFTALRATVATVGAPTTRPGAGNMSSCLISGPRE